MTEAYIQTELYSPYSHIKLAEGSPIPFRIPSTHKHIYETIDSSVYLVRIRKGFHIFDYYVSSERATDLIKNEIKYCE